MTIYHDGNRQMQDRFDSRRLADRLEERIVASTIGDGARAVIEAADCFFLATADADGRPSVSYKGGDPGFVKVVDDHTIAFPCYDGNGMFLSMGNALVNPAVGLLFIDFERPSRLRIQGDAMVGGHDPDPLLSDYPEAQFVVRVVVREVFPNCPRYIHRRSLVAPSEFVPRSGCVTPVPDWKRSSLAEGVLPAGDPAHSTTD